MKPLAPRDDGSTGAAEISQAVRSTEESVGVVRFRTMPVVGMGIAMNEPKTNPGL